MDYARHYAKLIARARHRPIRVRVPNTETHHIVPRCMGGGEERENLVRLTSEEHCTAHLLLAKMHPENPKVVYAATYMSGLASKLKLPANKRYGKAKRAAAKWPRRLGRQYYFRKTPRGAKRYSAADVERLRKMLTPRANVS